MTSYTPLPTCAEFTRALTHGETLSFSSPAGASFYLCRVRDGSMHLYICASDMTGLPLPTNKGAWYAIVTKIYHAKNSVEQMSWATIGAIRGVM